MSLNFYAMGPVEWDPDYIPVKHKYSPKPVSGYENGILNNNYAMNYSSVRSDVNNNISAASARAAFDDQYRGATFKSLDWLLNGT